MNQELAKYIDHTQLKADTTKQEMDQIIEEARTYNFASVCVNPHWVKYCYEALKDTEVNICTVIGFPLGASTSNVKAFEASQAIKDGATEIDMVLNIGELKSNDDAFVKRDIEAVVQAAKGEALTKVIIETALLTEDEKKRACQLAKEAGADFVKTSTGFSSSGATSEDIKLMSEIVGPTIGVKASGGIRDLETAQIMIAAGATRLGCSAGVQIINGSEKAITDY